MAMLIIQAVAISSVLLSPSADFPAKSSQGTLTRTWVPAPWAIA